MVSAGLHLICQSIKTSGQSEGIRQRGLFENNTTVRFYISSFITGWCYLLASGGLEEVSKRVFHYLGRRENSHTHTRVQMCLPESFSMHQTAPLTLSSVRPKLMKSLAPLIRERTNLPSPLPPPFLWYMHSPLECNLQPGVAELVLLPMFIRKKKLVCSI